jgi:hypothetical protein
VKKRWFLGEKTVVEKKYSLQFYISKNNLTKLSIMKLLLSAFWAMFLINGYSQTMNLKTIRKNERLPATSKFLAVTSTDAAPSTVLTQADKDAFLQKNIPSIIGKSGMAPAFFDNFNISLGDDELSVTSGTFTNDNKTQSCGGSLKASAPNGSRAIFQPGGKTPFDVEAQLKYTWELSATKWNLIQNGVTTTDISSISNKWINFSFSGNIAKQILFTDDTLNQTKNPFTYEALVSFNYLFNSFVIQSYIKRRVLLNIGAGFGRFTNYEALDEINLRKGSIYNNNQLSETEVISGRKNGDYKVFNGVVIRGAAYKPLTDPLSFSAVHLGATLNSFGLGSSNHILNGTTGLYFSKWKSEDQTNDNGTTTSALKEVFSVGLIADFKNLQDASTSTYIKDNFKLVVSAQIPLNFF